MDTNDTAKSTDLNTRSVIQCPQSPNFRWDLDHTTFFWILATFTSIASLATIILNALVIIAVNQKRELKKTSTLLLCSLAVADLLVGAIPMPLSVAADVLIIRGSIHVSRSGFCALRMATEFFMFSLIWPSLYHLTLIAWERYVVVQKLMSCRVIVTKTRLKKLAIAAWMLGAFTSFPPNIMGAAGVDYKIKNVWHIGESILGTACLIIIGYFYIVIYFGVRKHNINGISQVNVLIKAKQESKLALTTALITGALILSFVPMIVLGGLVQVFPVLGRNAAAFHLIDLLIQFNSLINPLLYVYRDRRFSKAVLELLRLKKTNAIQPMSDVRFVRQKDLSRQIVIRHAHLTRAATCDLFIDSGNLMEVPKQCC